jgi:hypothetical protein
MIRPNKFLFDDVDATATPFVLPGIPTSTPSSANPSRNGDDGNDNDKL